MKPVATNNLTVVGTACTRMVQCNRLKIERRSRLCAEPGVVAWQAPLANGVHVSSDDFNVGRASPHCLPLPIDRTATVGCACYLIGLARSRVLRRRSRVRVPYVQ